MTSETEIFNWLDKSEYVNNYQVIAFDNDELGYLLKLKIEFIDKSELFTRELVENNLRNYSFHWQTETGMLIVRWDNAKHHRDLSTYPHHRHEPDNISESYDISLSEVLRFIFKKIKGD